MPTIEIDTERFLSVPEAAKRSGYSYDHVRMLIRKGVVASQEVAPRVKLVDMVSLEAHIKSTEAWRASHGIGKRGDR